MRAVSTPIDSRSYALQLEHDGTFLSWADVAAGLVSDPGLRAALTGALVATPFEALYWETRSVAPDDRNTRFESVILDAPGLARVRANSLPFAEPLAGARAPAVHAFPNLSGDAELIVPAPDGDPVGYPHILAFLRRAPEAQTHALWTELGHAVDRWHEVRGTRVWVSTAGLGVSWLHLRLDSRPKYVKWGPYRAAQ